LARKDAHSHDYDGILMMRHAPLAGFILTLLLAPAAVAQPATARAIAASAPFKAAVAALDADYDRIVSEIVTLTEIPAPPFKEGERAKAYMAMLRDAGLTDVEMDEEGNVMGLRRGTGPAGGKLVVMAAHLDTVFPEGTDVKVRREGTRLMAPGIGDDTRGLATLLGYARALDKAGVTTRRDILFMGNVGEEGQGDLRGMRYFFGKGKYRDRVAIFMSMDGSGATNIVNGGVGSKRYRITFNGPGGHSFGAFGLVNPLTALGQTVVDLYRIQVPASPKTTYSASVIGGGTSVNSIPNSVFLEVDMRSEDAGELTKLEKQFLTIVPAAVAGENAARQTTAGLISADIKLIGDRPAGSTPAQSAIVVQAQEAVRAAGLTPSLAFSSTDSNLPMSLGIPAITFGSGGPGGRAHALDEWIDVDKARSLPGMAVGLNILLAAADL
jgi:tripeptide aminopeptidase